MCTCVHVHVLNEFDYAFSRGTPAFSLLYDHVNVPQLLINLYSTMSTYMYNTSSTIHLLFPLTKESVSTNNLGGQNYGGNGTIETVAVFNTNSSTAN